MIDTSWSKLIDSDMGQIVKESMSDPCLTYHNFDHVRSLYHYAKETGVKYDVNLDAAILWHDAVYDDQPLKEQRSADLFRKTASDNSKWSTQFEIGQVVDLILTTDGHRIQNKVSNDLIRLDLHELSMPETAERNFWKVLDENKNLYNNVSYGDIAKGGSDFLETLMMTCQYNMEKDKPDMKDFWHQINHNLLDTHAKYQFIVELYGQNFEIVQKETD